MLSENKFAYIVLEENQQCVREKTSTENLVERG